MTLINPIFSPLPLWFSALQQCHLLFWWLSLVQQNSLELIAYKRIGVLSPVNVCTCVVLRFLPLCVCVRFMLSLHVTFNVICFFKIYLYFPISFESAKCLHLLNYPEKFLFQEVKILSNGFQFQSIFYIETISIYNQDKKRQIFKTAE